MASTDDESFEDDPSREDEGSGTSAEEWSFLIEDAPVGPWRPVMFEGPKHYGRETWNHYAEEALRRISSKTVIWEDERGTYVRRLSEDVQPNQGMPDLREYRLRPLWSEPGDPSQPRPVMPDFDDFDERERYGWKAHEAVHRPDRPSSGLSGFSGVETGGEEPPATEAPSVEGASSQPDYEDGQALPVRRPEPKDDQT